MKMLIVVYNDAIDETIITAFKEAQRYTKWKETPRMEILKLGTRLTN